MLPLEPTPYSKDYEITDAMFGAFRSPGGMPFFWKLLGWSTLFLTLIGVVLIPQTLSTYVDLIRVSVQIEADPNSSLEAIGVVGKFFVVMGVYMVVYIALIALIRAAFFRGYFFGELGGTFPFEFGADEVRQCLSMLGFYVLLMLVMIGISLVGMIPMIFLVMSFGEQSILAIVLGMIVLYVGLFGSYIYFGVKFYCAGALTALRGQTHVVAARYVSRNRFWAILGSILVAGLIGYVISYVTFTVGILIAFSGLNMADLMTIMSGTDPERALDAIERLTETASFRLASLVGIVLTSGGYAFYSLMMAGPQAYFTRQWAEAGAAAYDLMDEG